MVTAPDPNPEDATARRGFIFAKADSTVQVELGTEVKGLDIHYTFDNSFPDQFYPKYTEPLIMPKDAFMLRVITYRGDKPVGRMITITAEELKKRAKNNRNYPNQD